MSAMSAASGILGIQNSNNMTKTEAIDRLREVYAGAGDDTKAALEALIPELSESEDDRIRKWLIAELHHEHDMVETDSIHPEYAYKRKEML